MQDALALLSAALDASGYIAIRGFGVGAAKGKQPRQKFYAPGEYIGACAEAERLSKQGYDTYFATSTFLTNKSAEAANVNAVKCFKIDLDVAADDTDKYSSKKDAVAALADFCTHHGLPVPVLVDSGYGVHGYWCLTEALDANDGKLYSEKLKSLFIAHGLKHDRTVTGDIARVLRVPGTLNNKNAAVARRVKLKSAVTTVDTDLLLDLIDALCAATPNLPSAAPAQTLLLGALPKHLQGVQLDKDTLGMISGSPKSFAVLVARMNAGAEKTCAQIKDIYDKQGKQSEARWRSGLSIAHFCDDGDTAIHDMSNRYPNYDRAETIKKAALIKGPYKCTTFQANWPTLCVDCPSRGKITSPIQLGDYVPLAEKGAVKVLAQNKTVDDGLVDYEIPEYPWPYARGAKGGVYRKTQEDEHKPDLVSKFDLYVLDRLRDEATGYLVHMRHHHPKDGVVDFMIDTSVVGNKEKLQKELNSYGIMMFEKEVTMVRDYIRTWNSDLELKNEVSKVKTQFGWTKDFKSFVIGNRELTENGWRFSRTAPSMAPASDALAKVGEYNEWRKVFNTYARPGFTPYAFCALVGFGAPLLQLLNYNGMLINAFAKDSGTGKTTTLQAATSIWGNPDIRGGVILTCGPKGDTALARFQRMGWYNNLPICVDEVTKMPEDEMSDFLLSITQGRGRHRMNASSNSERINNTTWSTIALSSSNKTFVSALQVDKDGVDGELMRLLEVHLPQHELMSKEESEATFGPLVSNYGHAGGIYVQHLMQNWAHVKQMIEDERRTIDTMAGCVRAERYWSAACACIIAGGRLAQEATLHDIDMDAVRAFAVDLIRASRARLQYAGKSVSGVEQRSDMLGEFMNTHISSTLVVEIKQINGKEVCTPLREPTRDLVIRYERNLSKLYVSQSALNRYAKERNAHLDQYLDDLKAQGVFVCKDKQKRLGTGLPMPGNPVRVYEFNLKDDALPPLI